jgi:DNA-binding XRE family transcriptional regulator
MAGIKGIHKPKVVTRSRRRSQKAQKADVNALDSALAALPEPDADGNRPARETALAILAAKMLQRRLAAGWTQQELASRAGVRPETVSRLETGKHAPNTATFLKLERAMRAAGV